MDEPDKFIMNKKRFQAMVETEVKSKRINYLDAILHLCEQHQIDPEDAKKYISPIIKDKLEADALRLNFISGGHSYLPLDS